MNPDSLPFRIDSERRARASKEDYVDECEMVQSSHETKMIRIMAFEDLDL